MFDMSDFIDDDFTTHTVKVIRYANHYVDGVYVSEDHRRYSQHGDAEYGSIQYQDGIAVSRPNIEIEEQTEHSANVQPLAPKERQAIEQGGQRLLDAKKIYFSDGSAPKVFPSDRVEISGIEGQYEVVQSDVRAEQNYCKIIVSRVDV